MIDGGKIGIEAFSQVVEGDPAVEIQTAVHVVGKIWPVGIDGVGGGRFLSECGIDVRSVDLVDIAYQV